MPVYSSVRLLPCLPICVTINPTVSPPFDEPAKYPLVCLRSLSYFSGESGESGEVKMRFFLSVYVSVCLASGKSRLPVTSSAFSLACWISEQHLALHFHQIFGPGSPLSVFSQGHYWNFVNSFATRHQWPYCERSASTKPYDAVI